MEKVTRELRDYFRYEIWAYTDNSVELHASTDLPTLDRDVCCEMAQVVARNFKEEVRDARMVFNVQVFEDGSTSTNWRDEEDLASTYRRFLWAKRSLHYGTFGCVIPHSRMPRWLVNLLGTLEYAAARLCDLWLRARGLEAFSNVHVAASASGLPPARESSSELAGASEGAPPPPAGAVVVPFRRPR